VEGKRGEVRYIKGSLLLREGRGGGRERRRREGMGRGRERKGRGGKGEVRTPWYLLTRLPI